MPARVFPGLNLRGGYNAGESGWGVAMTEDMRKLSAIVNLSVTSRISTLPGSPAEGVRYILTTDQTVQLRENGAWVPYTPQEGWVAWVVAEQQAYRFVGGSWIVMSAGGGVIQAQDVLYNAAEEGDSNSTETTVSGALDDLYFRVRSVSGGVINAVDVIYANSLDSNSTETNVAAVLDQLALRPYDVGLFIRGGAGDVNKDFTFVVTRDFYVDDDFAGSRGYAATTDASDRTFTVKKNGSSIGSLTFAATSNTCTFTTTGTAESFVAGDRLTITTPAALGTLADISLTFNGTRR